MKTILSVLSAIFLFSCSTPSEECIELWNIARKDKPAYVFNEEFLLKCCEHVAVGEGREARCIVEILKDNSKKRNKSEAGW